MLISQILRRKGDEVATIAPAATVSDVVEALAEHGVGALVVSADGETIEGIISERDVVRSLAANGAGALGSSVADVMTTDVVTCGLDATTEELMVEMTKRRFRHMPVTDNGALAGIVSIGDVVDARLRELETERQQLTDYISGH